MHPESVKEFGFLQIPDDSSLQLAEEAKTIFLMVKVNLAG